jgi:hypothetical protein
VARDTGGKKREEGSEMQIGGKGKKEETRKGCCVGGQGQLREMLERGKGGNGRLGDELR